MCLVSRWFQCWSGVMIADALCKGRMGTGKGTAEPLGKRVDGTGFILRVGGQALVALGFALKDICFTLKPAAKASDLPVIVAAIRIEAYRPRASPASSATLTPRIGRSKAVAELCPHCDRQVRNLRTPKSETLGKVGVPAHAAAGWTEGGHTQRVLWRWIRSRTTMAAWSA